MTRSVQNGRARQNASRTNWNTKVWGGFPGLAPRVGVDSTVMVASMNRTLHRLPGLYDRNLVFFQSAAQVASRPPRGGR